MTNTTADLIRSLDDEALDSLIASNAISLIRTLDPAGAGRIEAEIARRAEIRINRGMDAEYGPNPYGFTLDDVRAKHDASWYESRQTEDQFLAEMGVEA